MDAAMAQASSSPTSTIRSRTSVVGTHHIPHRFQETTLITPTTCSACRRFIWGLSRASPRCTECGHHYHSQCLPFVADDCGLTDEMLLVALHAQSTSGGTHSRRNSASSASGSAAASAAAASAASAAPRSPLLGGGSAKKEYYLIKRHEFRLFTYKSFTWCDICKNFIWGFVNQGYRCAHCFADAHVGCLEKASPCVAFMSGGMLPLVKEDDRALKQHNLEDLSGLRHAVMRKKQAKFMKETSLVVAPSAVHHSMADRESHADVESLADRDRLPDSDGTQSNRADEDWTDSDDDDIGDAVDLTDNSDKVDAKARRQRKKEIASLAASMAAATVGGSGKKDGDISIPVPSSHVTSTSSNGTAGSDAAAAAAAAGSGVHLGVSAPSKGSGEPVKSPSSPVPPLPTLVITTDAPAVNGAAAATPVMETPTSGRRMSFVASPDEPPSPLLTPEPISIESLQECSDALTEPGSVKPAFAKPESLTEQLSHQRFEDYDISPHVLGSGQFGKVYSAVHRPSGRECAIKLIDKRRFWGRRPESTRHVKREIAVMAFLGRSHPNVVTLLGVFDHPQYIYIVMELVQDGDLLSYVEQKGHLSEDEAKFMFHQLAVGVKYLHDNGVVHRDLKPENLLLRKEDGVMRVKIADFGFANLIGKKTFLHSVVGTPAYFAPEVYHKAHGGYGKPADMWSIGVMLYACLSGIFPFDEDESVEEQIRAFKFSFPDEYWIGVSDIAIDLVCKLLVVEPRGRYTIDEMLRHPWFTTSRQLDIDVPRA